MLLLAAVFLTIISCETMYASAFGLTRIEEKADSVTGEDTEEEIQSWTIGSIKAALENGTLTISGSGRMPDYTESVGAPWYTYGWEIRSIVVSEGITYIGNYAFAETSAEELILPNSLQGIGEGAFSESRSLLSATIPDQVTELGEAAFEFCSSLTKVTVGKGIRILNADVFYNCMSLTSVSLSSGLETISEYAFYKCTALTSLKIPDTVTYIDGNAFQNCNNLKLTVPSALTKLDDGSYQLVDNVSITGTFDYTSAYEVVKLVNKERSAQGLSSLKMDKDLLSAAMQRAAETSIYFSHTRPSNIDCFSISSKARGENIAMGMSSASAAVSTWMNSSGHRANILGSNYKSIGVGCFTQGGSTYWVQIFGSASASTGSQPSNREKSVTVSLNRDLFSNRLVLLTSGGSSLMVGKKANLYVYVENPEVPFEYSQLDASSFKWSSSSAATVSSKGVLTGAKKGTAKVTAAVKNGSLSAKGSMKITSVKKGTVYTINKIKYKVTATSSSSKKVTVTGPSSKNVTSVTIPATVKIGSNSYKVTKIAASAFSGCTKLKKVTIGSKITSIGKKAFYGDKKLSTVTLKTTKLTKSSVGSNAFKGIKSTCTFKVPSKKVSSYKKIFKAAGAGSKITVKKG